MRHKLLFSMVLFFVLPLCAQKEGASTPSLKEVILSYPVKKIAMEEATLSGAVSFLRFKATEALRVTMADEEAVMIFELSFEPDGNNGLSKLNKEINYKAEGVSLGEAMRSCLEQVGLEYKFISKNRIAIVDKK